MYLIVFCRKKSFRKPDNLVIYVTIIPNLLIFKMISYLLSEPYLIYKWHFLTKYMKIMLTYSKSRFRFSQFEIAKMYLILIKEDTVKESKFFSVLFVIIVFMLALTVNPSYAQEESAVVDTVIQEEVVPIEEAVEEEAIVEEAVEEQAPAEETVKEEPSMFKPGWSVKAYINGGVIEPWGDPGTGQWADMGMRIQGGAQLNIAKWFKLPTVLQPLTVEVMGGYGMWNVKSDWNSGSYTDGSTNVISILANARYDVTDLIMKAIGFEYPALGIFGVVGFQYNMQNWDFPNWTEGTEVREYDAASAFGINLGVGVKYNLQSMVGKPVEIDLRFTQSVFIMGDVQDQHGHPFYSDGSDYQHTENGLLLGVAYPF